MAGIEPGRYKIVNAAPQHKVLDLDDSDKISVIGWDRGSGDNQLWDVQSHPDGSYTLRNVRGGKYVCYMRSYDGNVNGLSLACTPSPDQRTHWYIRRSPNVDTWEIHQQVQGRDAIADMSNRGQGQPVVLWEAGAHSPNQQWFFERTY